MSGLPSPFPSGEVRGLRQMLPMQGAAHRKALSSGKPLLSSRQTVCQLFVPETGIGHRAHTPKKRPREQALGLTFLAQQGGQEQGIGEQRLPGDTGQPLTQPQRVGSGKPLGAGC